MDAATENEMEITIGGPIATKIIDTCVGTDNKRYYRIQWDTSWESEDDVLVRYQNLVETYWREEQERSEASAIVDIVLDKAVTQHNMEVMDGGGDTIANLIAVNSPERQENDAPEKDVPPPLLPQGRCDVEHDFKCDKCSRSYSTAKKLKDHKRKFHQNRGSFKCTFCPKVFPSKRGAQEHINRHTGLGPQMCPGCNKRYITVNDLQRHKKICEMLVQKDFQCEICQKCFATKAHLTFHLKIHIPNEQKPFACTYCPRRFAYNHDCVHHMRLHVGEKPFKCDQCDAAFHRKSYLTEHMFVHTGVSKYQCSDCGIYLKTQQMLKTHVKNVHILKKEKTDKENTKSKPVEEMRKEKRNTCKKSKRYKCPDCRKDFRFMKELHYHQALNHKDKLNDSSMKDYEPTMVYKCKKCERSFPHPASLRKHSETHKLLEIPPPSQTTSDESSMSSKITKSDSINCKNKNSVSKSSCAENEPQKPITDLQLKDGVQIHENKTHPSNTNECVIDTPVDQQNIPVSDVNKALVTQTIINLSQQLDIFNSKNTKSSIDGIRSPDNEPIVNGPLEMQDGLVKVQLEGEEAHILIPAAFSCNSCDAILTNQIDMIEHLRSKHSIVTSDAGMTQPNESDNLLEFSISSELKGS